MKNPNILLVDDDEIYLYLMEKTINKLSSELIVNSFTDAIGALDYLRDRNKYNQKLPEIILLDLNMPYLDGWGFLNEYKHLKSKLKQPIDIYMISSSTREEDIQKAESFEEVAGYMIKPLQERALTKIFKEAYNGNW